MAVRIISLLLCLGVARGDFRHVGALSYGACKSHCLGVGRRLPCVQDNIQQAALLAFQDTHGYSRAWLGYHDTVQEGVWEWEDGCQSSFTSWGQSFGYEQPDNYNLDEHCAESLTHPWPVSWNDVRCQSERVCLCEACQSGWFYDGTSCSPCDAGSFLEPVDGVCLPCPPGYHSDPGQTGCLLLARTAAASIGVPAINVAHDGFGHVIASVEVDPLPNPDILYGGSVLEYTANLLISNSPISDASCTLQQLNATFLGVTVSVGQIWAKCGWAVFQNDGITRLHGSLTVWVGEQGGHEDLAVFVEKVELDFPTPSGDADSADAMRTVVIEGQVFHMANLTSKLAFYETEAYDKLRPSANFEVGSEVAVEVATVGGDELLALRVWLSSSPDPAAAGSLDLTQDIREPTARLDSARFAFTAGPAVAQHCSTCVIHVLCVVSHRGRELGTSVLHTLAGAPLSISSDGDDDLYLVIIPVSSALFIALIFVICVCLLRGQWRRRRVPGIKEDSMDEGDREVVRPPGETLDIRATYAQAFLTAIESDESWQWARNESNSGSLQLAYKALQEVRSYLVTEATMEEGRSHRAPVPAPGLRLAHGLAQPREGLTPVPGAECEVFRAVLRVTCPDELGKGRDVRAPCAYSGLEFQGAWALFSEPQCLRYSSTLASVGIEMNNLRDRGLTPPSVTSKLEEATADLPAPGGVPLDSSVSEKWLLHGTKPQNLIGILDQGLNKNLSDSGLFGRGIYLAEDPEKMDQYCTPDPGSDSALDELHRQLFPEGRHPGGDMFYALLVRAACGYSCRTEDREKGINLDAREHSVWVGDRKQDLAVIAGSKPKTRYHSLVCEVGPAIKRFREFVIYQDRLVQVGYLLAYKRV